jgi:REP element-mobilizing transposase RayT
MRQHVGLIVPKYLACIAGDRNMSYSNFLFHIVFATKGRLPMIDDSIRSRFHQYLGGTVRGLGGILLEVNSMYDHIHLLVKLKPTILFSDFMRDLKSNSSGWAKQNGMTKFAWQRRYGAFTVSESQAQIVREYIRNQQQHHKKFDFKTEFETMLESNGIPVDDFVWQE